jgi:2,5-diketo-D-gluconate reductase A
MAKEASVTLSNGIKMPLLGLGVYQIRDHEECEQAVYDAIETGYRLIDTAASYGNEEAVGRAIKRSGVPRGELFVTSKLWIPDVNYAAAKKAYQTSLDKLQLEYLDLYLIHQPYNDIYGAWRAMQELYEEGNVKAIGVSNFASDRLVDLILNNKIAPMVNQVEIHPFNQQVEAMKWMRDYHVQPEGWAPFAEGRQNLFTDERLVKIAEPYHKSVAQVVLRWNIQRGVVAIPKSVRQERIIENFDIFDFELSEEDMEKISRMDEKKGLFVVHEDPAFIKMLRNRTV